MMRFAHGKNLTFDGVNIDTNYQGHGLELIACKDCVVKNCKILAKNNKTKNKMSVEEALQIDIATPLTAPGILREGGKQSYVNRLHVPPAWCKSRRRDRHLTLTPKFLKKS